jgi:hypothetical protein
MRIEITREEVAQRLKVLFKDEYPNAAEAVTDLLAGNDHAMSVLFKMSLGINLKLKYKKHDQVLIKVNDLATWYFNKDITKNNPDMLYKGMMLVRITKVNKYASEPYEITYTALDDSGDAVVVNQSINEYYIQSLYEDVSEVVK